jgi:histidinol-phosphatase (PHP family)
MGDAALMDLHVHSSFSHDGQGTIADYCRRAEELGLWGVGFCEHLDLDEMDPLCGMHDYEAFRAAIEDARACFGGRLRIRMGVEVGYLLRIEKEIAAYLETHPYDYVIGSVHTIFENAGISSEYEALETFARHEFWEAYEEYFAAVLSLVRSGLFDVVGHLDLIERFGVNYRREEMDRGRLYGIVTRIFEGMTLRRMALEVNASGLRQQPCSTYPGRKLLALYRELGGGMVTLGSDAHEPGLLASGIREAESLARSLGLEPVSFCDRQPESLYPA